MDTFMKRRSFLAGAGISVLGAGNTGWGSMVTTTVAGGSSGQGGKRGQFGFCLNTSTIRGQKLTLPEQIQVAGQAGYDAIELWMGDIHRFVESGGKLDDVRRLLEDWRLAVPSAIGFAPWIVDDPTQRADALRAARRDMEALRALGGTRIAAPPAGATDRVGMDLRAVAERYRKLLELGDEMGVVPQLELWGFSKTLSRLGEVAFVVAEAAHPHSCALLDVYHIYKGGSDFSGLRLFGPSVLHVFHINDYPADPPRTMISDAHRVYPGDGVAPLTTILRMLDANGAYPYLSLELFNAEYWQKDALEVAETGLSKMRKVVEEAFSRVEQ